jgi:hypothetical protein
VDLESKIENGVRIMELHINVDHAERHKNLI